MGALHCLECSRYIARPRDRAHPSACQCPKPTPSWDGRTGADPDTLPEWDLERKKSTPVSLFDRIGQ